ncbi:MAM and fibronectin type III domain-containing protein 2-like [Montipora capricornis]|uniref:MAM and fibronectin type III domain-containing protein 2-like n=1 Tax=Montipora capricornis TaxID=246305 RepID=UPI0035F1195C
MYWTIESVGMTNAFILLSLKELRFDYCWSEFLKVFSSNGAEMFTHERCFEDHRGVVELQFGEGNFVTLQTQLYSRYSRLNLEFVIVRRSLHSALSPSTAWNIHGFNTSQKSLFVDWSNVPGDLQADFFILSLNQTRPQLYYKDGRASSFFL